MEKREQEEKLDQIEERLKEYIEKLGPIQEDNKVRGRPRVLPALCLWVGLLVCVLRGMGSQLAIWRMISQKGLWNYPQIALSDQAIYKRLEQGGVETVISLFGQISGLLRERIAGYIQEPLAPFASQVVAIDVTALDPIARLLPSLRELQPGDRQLLPGKLAGIFDLRYQQWLQVQHIEDPEENEKVTSRDLLASIEKNALILADMGYFGFKWFDDLTEQGYYWISRLRQKTSFSVIHTYYQNGETFDGLIWLGAYRADRAKYAVRLVTYRQGQTLYRYITNVRDPKVLGMGDIASMYARRWDIELVFKLIKRELGLHLFWSAKQVVILQQVWAVLIVSQVLLALRMEIAGRAGVDPFDVSLHLMVEYIPRWSVDGTDMITFFVERGRQAGFIRPSRRIKIRAPVIDPDLWIPVSKDLILTREPRYAGKL
jgi:hypothetical protein